MQSQGNLVTDSEKHLFNGNHLLFQVHYIHQLVQSRLCTEENPLVDLYNCLRILSITMYSNCCHNISRVSVLCYPQGAQVFSSRDSFSSIYRNKFKFCPIVYRVMSQHPAHLPHRKPWDFHTCTCTCISCFNYNGRHSHCILQWDSRFNIQCKSINKTKLVNLFKYREVIIVAKNVAKNVGSLCVICLLKWQ